MLPSAFATRLGGSGADLRLVAVSMVRNEATSSGLRAPSCRSARPSGGVIQFVRQTRLPFSKALQAEGLPLTVLHDVAIPRSTRAATDRPRATLLCQVGADFDVSAGRR